MHKELYIEKEGYMYTAQLDNGDTVYAFDNGTARGNGGKLYRLVTHLDENDEVVTDGWIELK